MLIPGTVGRVPLYPRRGSYALFDRIPLGLTSSVLPDDPPKPGGGPDRGGRFPPTGRPWPAADATPGPGGARPSGARREPGGRAEDRRRETAATRPQHGRRRRAVGPPAGDVPRTRTVLPAAVHA